MAGLGRRTHYRKHLTDSVLNDFPEPDPAQGERIAKVVATRGGNIFEVLVAASSSPAPDAAQTTTSNCIDNEGQSPANDVSVTSSSPQSDYDTTSTTTTKTTNVPRTPQLAILPTKYHKLVWVKRNDFVIVQAGAESRKEQDELIGAAGSGGRSGIRYLIAHILYKEQVKHLIAKNLWPINDDQFRTHEQTDQREVVDDDVRQRAIALVAEQGEQQHQQRRNADPGWTSGEEEDGADDECAEEQYGHRSDEQDDGIVYNDVVDDDYFVNTNRIAAMTIQDSSDSDSSDDE